MFNSPNTGGDICKPADVAGHLLIVKAVDYKAEVRTSMGPSEAISVDIADLDSINPATGQPHIYRGSLWFNVALVNALRSQIGQLVLARMGQGTAKPGQSAPWILDDATNDPGAVAQATAWMNQHPEFQGLTAPAATQQAPAAAVPVAAAPQIPAGINPVTGEISPELAALLAQVQQKAS